MSTYIFILGKDPDLSLAELEAKYPDPESVVEGEQSVVLGLESLVGQKEFDCLGGQIKAGELFAKVKKSELIGALADHLSHGHDSGKLNYGVSLYDWPEKNLRLLLLDLKKEFKSRGLTSRFANQNFENLSVAQYKGLDGAEILVAKQEDDFYLAEVVAVQDIDAYSKRDYEKPFRDMRVGMLPPKLAQIMINLAGNVKAIWDPFCGGGGLVMEGLLMGHPMLGSDINEETLAGAQKNIDWLKKEFKVRHEAELFAHDATRPLPNANFEAVVCEGYLGPPQGRLKSRREFLPVVRELTSLYRSFFSSLKKSGFDGPVVIGLPFYQTREGVLYLEDAIRLAEDMGFKLELSLEYARKDQLVGRHVLRFRMQK
jgi:hypothetical protein